MSTRCRDLVLTSSEKRKYMIEKIKNPLNLNIDVVNGLIPELQMAFDAYSAEMPDGFSLNEAGVAIEIEMTTGTYSYDLEQLKKLKAEFEDPLFQSLKEVS